MTNANYCTDCGETLTLHADGSITCSCDSLDADSEKIPKAWELTLDELRTVREDEDAYTAHG